MEATLSPPAARACLIDKRIRRRRITVRVLTGVLVAFDFSAQFNWRAGADGGHGHVAMTVSFAPPRCTAGFESVVSEYAAALGPRLKWRGAGGRLLPGAPAGLRPALRPLMLPPTARESALKTPDGSSAKRCVFWLTTERSVGDDARSAR